MSIDREVNARVEAYSGNPQALQKKYAMTKELVDLLALQRIKKGMDQQRNNIAMAMQTNPATIKQQREKEVFARTAEDVAQQVGGTLKNMQRQRSQGLQRLAQRAVPQRGLGALMPQQRQRPQKRMMAATGGIVGFDGRDGSRVSGPLAEFERIDEDSTYTPPDLLGLAEQADIEELIRRGILPKNFKGSLSAERAKEMLSRSTSQEPKTVDTPPPVEAKPPTQDQTEGIAAIAEPEIPTADNALVLRSQQNVPAGTSVAPSGSGTAPTEPQEFDLQTALKEVNPVEYTPVDRADTGVVGIERLRRFGMDLEKLKSPEEVGKTAYETAAEQLGITVSDEDAKKGVLTKDAERRKGLEDLIEIDKALSDPKRLRREQFIDFLLGGAGRGRSTLAGAGAAAVNRRRAQDRGIRSRQIERNNMVKEIQDANTMLIQSAQARGDTATTRQANIINNAMQTLAQYDEAELAARRTDASNKMQVNIANYERKISEIELLAEQAQNRIQARIDRGDALRDVQNDARDQLEAVSEQFSTLQAEAIRNDAVILEIDKAINEEAKKSNPDQKRLEALRVRRVSEVARVREGFIVDNPRLHDLRQSLVDTINQLGSQIQSTLGVGSGVSGQQVDSAVQRQLQKGIPPYLQPYNP